MKADGYGHGAIETSLHLADHCGADAFAVATVDEGVALRKALNKNNGISVPSSIAEYAHNQIPATIAPNGIGNERKRINSITGLFHPPPSVYIGENTTKTSDTSSIGSAPLSLSSVPLPHLATSKQAHLLKNKTNARSPNIRILVLGPPTNLPDDFALYQQFNLELMCSGPQMARALIEWVADCDARRIQEVEKAATYQQSILMQEISVEERDLLFAKNKKAGQASTLSNMEGKELGKELKAILLKKKNLDRNGGNAYGNRNGGMFINGDNGSTHASTIIDSVADVTLGEKGGVALSAQSSSVSSNQNVVPFKGIEDAAKTSRVREIAAAKFVAATTGEDENDDDVDNLEQNPLTVNPQSPSIWNAHDANDTVIVSSVSSATVKDAAKKVTHVNLTKGVAPASARRKIRWHALVDSGMGRLGFKSVEDEDGDGDGDDEVSINWDVARLPAPLQAHAKKDAKWKVGPHRDTVSIIKAMVDAEIHGGAPIEFYGMCTHMAEASSDSKYTNEQMTRFKSLLKRVREASIAVPTISTDNSSALLTTNLTHFDPSELLKQSNGTNSLGYVRTGGGIFGQRPAFPILKPISTLTASVRHVAILQAGQSVGYDRAYIAERNVRIATLTIGFADGYPRNLGNGEGLVSIHGKLFPVAGNVCMDMMMVDLGASEDTQGIGSQVCVGDVAYLWGNDENNETSEYIRLEDLSSGLKTTQSALTCGLDKLRVRRQYVD